MNIALDTNAYSDFMRGDRERIRIVRAARSIAIPIIVLGELRAGFAGPAEHTDLDHLIGTWQEDPEFDLAIADVERVDEDA